MQHSTTTLLASIVLTLFSLTASAVSAAADPGDVARLAEALDKMSRWVEEDAANGQRWNTFLRTDELRREMGRGKQADPAVVARVLQQYASGADGLNGWRFVAVREALRSWLRALKLQYTGDLEKLAWASRGDHLPLTAERFEPIRAALRTAAERLQNRLGRSSAFADGWNQYLKWDLLAGHLTGDAPLDSRALRDLDAVLKQFRANKPGLELPVFTETAAALQRYRALVTWAALAQQTRNPKRSDTRSIYEKTMKGLQRQIQMQLEAPTPETTWRLGHSLGLLRNLNQSPELVRQLRSRFEQPNFFVEISEHTLNRVAQRPVSKGKPVRDVILGAQVRGWSDSVGLVSFRTVPAFDHAEVEVLLSGNIQSRTVSFKKPVRVSGTGSTNFVASKRLLINDDRFTALGAVASARTSTNIRSVRKTGGRFGRRLVERIAWKKVCESKSQAEAAASRSARRQVAESFDQELIEALTGARRNYDQKLRPPLVRRGAFPEHLRMSSTERSIQIEATLASSTQLSSDSLPPGLIVGHDMSVRLHQSAIENYLPLALAGLTIKQDTPEQEPQIEGDAPAWLKKISHARFKSSRWEALAEAIPWTPAEDASQVTTVAFEEDAAGPELGQETQEKSPPAFKPWRMKLSDERPVSVTLRDQQITIRIRIAEIQSGEDEEPLTDWDFVVVYEILQDGNGMLLRRVGRIEVYPTGFDPRWEKKKLSTKKLGIRNNISRNLNKRAAAGEGFPSEIPIKPILIPVQGGAEQTLLLEQLDCDDGWLTLGWRLP